MRLNKTASDQQHPLNFTILIILFITAVFTAENIWQYLIILGIAYLNLLILTRPIKYKLILIFLLCLLPALLAIFFSSYIFTANNHLLSKTDTALLLTIRYLSLALVSFTYSIHTPFTALFNYLIERGILSVKIGYSLLAAFNSFAFLSQEFKRIQIAYKMRYGRTFISPIILVALLTTAARYAHNLSISLYCRGINQHKTFLFSASTVRYFDYLLWIFNLTLIILVMIFLFPAINN